MPLFGGLKEENEKLRAELGRLAGLMLPEPAGEVMAKGSYPANFRWFNSLFLGGVR